MSNLYIQDLIFKLFEPCLSIRSRRSFLIIRCRLSIRRWRSRLLLLVRLRNLSRRIILLILIRLLALRRRRYRNWRSILARRYFNPDAWRCQNRRWKVSAADVDLALVGWLISTEFLSDLATCIAWCCNRPFSFGGSEWSSGTIERTFRRLKVYYFH